MTAAFTSLPEEFASPLTLAQERLGLFAHRVLWYAEVGSTNDIAGTFAENEQVGKRISTQAVGAVQTCCAFTCSEQPRHI